MASTTASGINNERRPIRLRGVRQRHWGSWVSEIRHPISKRRVWLGTFATQEEAARVYDAAAWIINGPKAKTNYPYCPLAFSNAFTVLPPSLRRKLHRCCLESLKLSPANPRQLAQSPSPSISPSTSPSNQTQAPQANPIPEIIPQPFHTIESSLDSAITFDYNPNPNCRCIEYQSPESAPIQFDQETIDDLQQLISPYCYPVHLNIASEVANPLSYDYVRHATEPAVLYDTACTLMADIDPQSSVGDGDQCDLQQIMYCNESLMELYHNYEHVLFGDTAAAGSRHGEYGNVRHEQNAYGDGNNVIDDDILSLMMSSEYQIQWK